LPPDSIAAPEDTVETSGLGGIYSAGLYIGKIVSIHEGGQGIERYAKLQPGVDFRHLENVLVLTNP
jgi:rod shape-determining protein MreC